MRKMKGRGLYATYSCNEEVTMCSKQKSVAMSNHFNRGLKIIECLIEMDILVPDTKLLVVFFYGVHCCVN